MRSAPVLLAVATLLAAAMLLAYDRVVVRPAQRIAVVDVAAIWQAKESQFASLLARGKSDDEREQAQALAAEFSRRLPVALEQLPGECDCIVISRSAVIGSSRDLPDLTARLREILGEGK